MAYTLFLSLIAALIIAGMYYLLWRYINYRSGPSDVTMNVFDELPQPVIFFDNKGLIRYINDYSQKTLGIRQEDFVDMPKETLFYNEVALKALTKQVSVAGTAGPEKLFMRSADGMRVIFNLSFAELKGTLGEYYGTFAYGEDARESEKLRVDLERHKASEKKLKALSESLARDFDKRTQELTISLAKVRREMKDRFIKDDLLRSSIEDIDFMLGEVHNRQKKNIKLLLNVLNTGQWPAASAPHKPGRLHLRIKAMHAVYEHLFIHKNMELVDVHALMLELTDRYNTIQSRECLPEINIDAEKHNLPVDQALPLGLALSEIIYEACKTAQEKPASDAANRSEITIVYAYKRLYNAYNIHIDISGASGNEDPTQNSGKNECADLEFAKMLIEDQMNGTFSCLTADAFSVTMSFPALEKIQAER